MRGHILLEADPTLWGAREKRAKSIIEVFKFLKFEVVTYGGNQEGLDEKIQNDSEADNFETQLGTANGHWCWFADHALDKLKSNLKPGDIVVATEPWHDTLFKGMICSKGNFMGHPVVEFGIDYLDAFAKHRFYSSWHCMSAASRGEFKEGWFVVPPYIPTGESSLFEVTVVERTAHPFRLDHLYAAGRGVPTIAPDWGVWRETIAHGRTGVLYRTLEGKEKAEKQAIELPPEQISTTMKMMYNVERVAEYGRKALERLGHG